MQAGGGVALSISTANAVSGETGDVPVLVSVKPPNGTGKTPSDICCVIDISWSMSMEATAGGSSESGGLSMLDVAKHAVRTVIEILGPQDRLSIISFCRESEVVLELTAMDAAGKDTAKTRLDGIGFGNGTALWEGINAAMLELQKNAPGSSGRFGHVVLLTDGETEDRDAVVPNLKRLQMAHERLPGTVSAFGFGYEIDSPLLVEIAEVSDGTYAFIPDAGFVGTVFVNCMSNLLVTMARDAMLTVEAGAGSSILGVLGRSKAECDSQSRETRRLRLGCLQHGQTKDIVLRMSVKPDAEPFLIACLEYTTLDTSGRAEAEIQVPSPADPTVEQQRCRCLFVDALAQVPEAASDLARAQALVAKVAQEVTASSARGDEKVVALLQDIQGQTTEALSRQEYWTKWGRHYTPSVMFAHRLQQCNNFKDPGVQVYGSDLFRDVQDEADGAFNGLPAPKITPAIYRYLGGGNIIRNPAYAGGGAGGGAGHGPVRAVMPAPSINMAAFNDRCAG